MIRRTDDVNGTQDVTLQSSDALHTAGCVIEAHNLLKALRVLHIYVV